MTPKEQSRLQILNSLLAEHMTLDQAAALIGLSPRHTRRILADFRENGANGQRGLLGENGTCERLAPWSAGCENEILSQSRAWTPSAWLDGLPLNTWNELLREAIGECELETGGVETPAGNFIEWLAEWAREVRRRQRGLLLLTAHRAKGLEFDHVVVLDGSWERVSHGEDADAPRRLYYVAMTRARNTVALARVSESHPYQDALLDARPVLERDGPAAFSPAGPELSRRYRRLSLSDVFLSFLGYRSSNHPVHQAIAALSPGDTLLVRLGSLRWDLTDTNGNVAGQLASSFEGIAGMRCKFDKVLFVALWDREHSEPEYRKGIRRYSWEVEVLELAFEPDS